MAQTTNMEKMASCVDQEKAIGKAMGWNGHQDILLCSIVRRVIAKAPMAKTARRSQSTPKGLRICPTVAL